MKLLLLSSGLLLAAQSVCWGTTIRFSEFGALSLIDVNGVHIQGVLLGFSPDQAFFNEVVGTAGNAVLSIDPVLSGPTTGFLTLSFDVPTSLLQFDVLLQSIFPIDDSDQGANGGPAYTVLLSSGVSLTGSTDPQPNGTYSEGTFLYNGAPIMGAVISFFSGVDVGGLPVGQFGLDNLTFITPEPSSFVGLGLGLLTLAVIRRLQNARPRG